MVPAVSSEVTRVTLIENFASHAAVQKLVDVKPDRTSPEISNPRCVRSSTCESLGHPHHAHEELNLAWVKPPYSAARVIICA